MVARRDQNADVPILDAWSALSFKRVLGNKRSAPATDYLQPTWVGLHARRLQAYDLLDALDRNVGRFFMAAHLDDRDQHREYGDASLIVKADRAAVLGEDQRIATEGADAFDPDDEDAENRGEAQRALAFQEWCEQWATAEQWKLKLYENETNTIKFGDGVMTLAWDAEKQRATWMVWEPGFYFPVLEDGNPAAYPKKVHIAWEILDPDDEKRNVRRVHRLTWELIETVESIRYPWNAEPVNYACVYSDGIWEFDLTGNQTVEDFSDGDADWQTMPGPDGTTVEIRNLPLGIDFLPVVHTPNTVALLAHFGDSILSSSAQILDDLANADTDVQASAATVGHPPIGLAGARLPRDNQGNPISPRWRPGEVWELDANGSLSTVDTSNALSALNGTVQALLDRLNINSRMPGSFLGRIQPGEIASGIALALSFGPLQSMVAEQRLVREDKYRLIFKFAHRFALAAGAADTPPEWIETTVAFGRYIPADLGATVTQVNTLLTAKAISTETAVRMLADAGLPIDDVAEEVRRIDQRNAEHAEQILAATGDVNAAREFLGMDPAPAPAPTRTEIPPNANGGTNANGGDQGEPTGTPPA